jgi:uncharacterized membrane protein YoaK (UPF0700 family)
MGLQNGALRHTGAQRDVHTYVTGTLLVAAHGVAQFCFWLGHRLRLASPGQFRRLVRFSFHHRSLRRAALAAMLWVLYLTGAACGTLTWMRCGVGNLLIPIFVTLLTANVLSRKSIIQGSSFNPTAKAME